MELYNEIDILASYHLWLTIFGIAILVVATLPRLLSHYPFSMSILLLGIGYFAIQLPTGLDAPNPFEQGDLTEHLTELGVIMALMGAGLKIDRPLKFSLWSGTWRLLGIALPLSIALIAFTGWWIAAMVPATALLLGAVISPTDPVLASEVQISSPGSDGENIKPPGSELLKLEREDEVRFTLTSEAGLNDGLVFPFVYMAISMVVLGNNPANWFVDWVIFDLVYKISVGLLAGFGIGLGLAKVLFLIPAKTDFAKTLSGMGALASTLILYGLTEYIGGYGFFAVFVGALTIRNYERKNDFHESLHLFAEKIERLLLAVILVALGAAIAGGLLDALTLNLILSAIIIVFLIRPIAGAASLIGFNYVSWRERLAISFFGIRGIGSIYYLSYALNKQDFPGADEIWALVCLIIVISIFTHGILASPVINYLDRFRSSK